MDPLTALALGGRALARYRQGDVAGALTDCDRAISINPGLILVYSNRGVMRWENGDLDGALDDFDQVIIKTPRDAQAFDSTRPLKASLIYERVSQHF